MMMIWDFACSSSRIGDAAEPEDGPPPKRTVSRVRMRESSAGEGYFLKKYLTYISNINTLIGITDDLRFVNIL